MLAKTIQPSSRVVKRRVAMRAVVHETTTFFPTIYVVRHGCLARRCRREGFEFARFGGSFCLLVAGLEEYSGVTFVMSGRLWCLMIVLGRLMAELVKRAGRELVIGDGVFLKLSVAGLLVAGFAKR